MSLSSFIFTVRRASLLNDAIFQDSVSVSARIACVQSVTTLRCQHDKERDIKRRNDVSVTPPARGDGRQLTSVRFRSRSVRVLSAFGTSQVHARLSPLGRADATAEVSHNKVIRPCVCHCRRIRAASRMKFGFRIIFVGFSGAESLRRTAKGNRSTVSHASSPAPDSGIAARFAPTAREITRRSCRGFDDAPSRESSP